MRMLPALAVGLCVLTLLTACAGKATTPTSSPLTTTATATATTTLAAAPPTQPSRTARWVDLNAGDCLAEPPPTDPAVVIVTVVDCSARHLAETYLRAALPVDAAVTNIASQQCDAGFSEYTGRPLANSGFTITYLIDSEQDRTSNNPYPSTVICLLQGADGQPMSGSARR